MALSSATRRRNPLVMSVDVRAEVTIARPIGEVAAVMFDPCQDALWTNGVVEAKPMQEGPLRRGARVERVSKFLGRRFEYIIEVVDASDRHVDMIATRPFEMKVRYELESDGESTRTAIRTSGGGTTFFRVAGPFLSRMVKRAISNDLEALRKLLEQGGTRP